MSSPLAPPQEVFAQHLAKLTGLDANVIRGWTLAEESSGAAQQRAQQGNNNWLNIGYFDSGAADWAKGGGPFSNPVSAAQATAQFLKGQRWGASPGIRKILGTAGMTPAQQMAAIASSGWASSAYKTSNGLRSTYALVSGQNPGVPPAASPGATPSAPVVAGKPTYVQATGPEQALKILNAKSGGEALLLYQDSKIKIRVDPTIVPELGGSGISPNAPAVVNEIKKYLGTKYVWGGESPAGFDCSGLLQYVWAKQGVHIPRVTTQQVKAGYQVQLNQLMPGDAVFFGSHDAPHHVGMYIGHGQFVQAPHTGDVVKISKLSDYMGEFAQARRFA